MICWKSGEKVVQETRRWDDDQGYSYAMRSKEDAQDYRYFPEPDLVPIVISDEWIDNASKTASRSFVTAKLSALSEMNLTCRNMMRNIITSAKKMADVFEATTAICNKPKKVSNWLMGETMRICERSRIKTRRISHFHRRIWQN